MKKTNIDLSEDMKAYMEHLSKIAKEVNEWPEEKKRGSMFYEELKNTQKKK